MTSTSNDTTSTSNDKTRYKPDLAAAEVGMKITTDDKLQTIAVAGSDEGCSEHCELQPNAHRLSLWNSLLCHNHEDMTQCSSGASYAMTMITNDDGPEMIAASYRPNALQYNLIYDLSLK
jgi:hypothetical protein